MIRASIVGGSGYAGGEVLRLLAQHPQIEIQQVTSQSQAGRYVHTVHPNLRGNVKIQFCRAEDLQPCDVLFLCLSHGETAKKIDHYAKIAEKIIDLSADFRLKDVNAYQKWYGWQHPAPQWLEKFVYGLPEFHREQMRTAKYISGVGCNATAANLALAPLAKKQLIERVVIEIKVGSSEGGSEPTSASHHPERSGIVRSFAPTGHRHQAEILQELGAFELHFSITSVEMVRGVMCTAHVFTKEKLADKDLWTIYRECYGKEPFIRLVKDLVGIHRYPEPRILAGTNYCDVGFERDPDSSRVVVMSALDNLMKGAAGSAVQALNLMMGWDEKTALSFTGLHP